MNNKGFTLIELLAVIVILSTISLVVVASVTSSLERRDIKECEEQIELAKNAAKIYFSLNDVCELSNNNSSCSVSISVLKTNNYFNQTNKINKLEDTDQVLLTSNGYEYSGTGECKE